jgi:colanic acid/amylovoran biosynthesis protein
MKKKILLMDLWTDANKGDLALQGGLISMLREKHPSSEIVGIFRFGLNEFDAALPEILSTCSMLDRYYGGLRKTQYAGINALKFRGILHKLISLYSFIELIFMLLFYHTWLKPLIPSTHRKVMDEISSADLVVWKGKNFRSYGGLSGLNRQATLLVAGVVARILNQRVYCVNASIWKMKSGIERWMVKTVLSYCRSVSVRDFGSMEVASSLSIPNYFFAHDLSFYYLNKLGKANNSKRQDNAIALTVTRWGSEQESNQYVDALIYATCALVRNGVRTIYIVPQVTRTAESSRPLIERFKTGVRGKYKNIVLHDIDKELAIPDLLSLYGSCKLLLGTRMHSCVFARFVDTPFVGIAYDDGPKWDILREFWPDGLVVPYTVSRAALAEKAMQVFANGDALIDKSDVKFKQLPALSFRNLRDI